VVRVLKLGAAGLPRSCRWRATAKVVNKDVKRELCELKSYRIFAVYLPARFCYSFGPLRLSVCDIQACVFR